MRYITDGVHLYEVERLDRNYGLAGGYMATVRDVRTDAVRSIGNLEFALCEPVSA